MSIKSRNSKRKTRVPNKYVDTVCDLNNKKDIDNKDAGIDKSVEARVVSEELEKNGVGGECDQKVDTGESKENSLKYVEMDCDKCNSASSDGIIESGMDMGTEGNNVSSLTDEPNVASSTHETETTVSTPTMPVNVQCETIKTSKVDSTNVNGVKPSYADLAKRKMPNFTIPNNAEKVLTSVPTEIDSEGIEVVIFDDDMIAEGSKKWGLTLCGYFVGCGMSVHELRYNLRKMWARHGFKDIIDSNNGIYFMKFHNENGLNFIVNNGPWMVNSKPLIVQKWDITMPLDKTEPDSLPIWVKLCNVPLEAWATNTLFSSQTFKEWKGMEWEGESRE